MSKNLKTLTVLTAAMISSATTFAESKSITLDLTKAETNLAFDADNGSWTETFNDNEFTVDSQCFSFLKYSIGDWFVWSGFTASVSADNARYADAPLTRQWSNMAMGGIALDADGNVKIDEYGAPVVDPKVPYIVGFYNFFSSERPCDIIINDGNEYDAVGCYVNLNSYTYYVLGYGDAFTRPFYNGDRLTLTAHGVHADNSESTVTVDLASVQNGDITRARGWKYVDLSPLGRVNEIYFTMNSTDTGAYGMNTPGYFCLDKLTVRKPDNGVNSVKVDNAGIITYNRSTGDITLSGADFAVVYDTAGHRVGAFESTQFNVSHLAHGVYIVRADGATKKFIR